MIESVAGNLSDASHHFFVHAIRSTISALRKKNGWFPFYHEHIQTTLPCTKEEWDSTSKVWRPLDKRDVLNYSKHDEESGKAREFRVDMDWIQDFLESRFKDDSSYMVDSFTGAARTNPKRETRLTDHNDHSYKGSLMDGLKALKDAVRRFNKPAIENLLVYKKRKAEEARQQVRYEETEAFRAHKRMFLEVPWHDRVEFGYPDTDSFPRWILLYEGQRHTAEHLCYRKRRKSYMNDLRCYDTVLRQQPRHVEGDIYEYDTAWRPQRISGRVSEKGGGLQSASREMKAAAYDGVDCYNWDIKGSQLRDVIETTEMVPDIDTEELRQVYVDTSKADNADDLGISRDTYKRLLYATIFLGSWAPDLTAALEGANVHTGVPQVVKILRSAGWEQGIDVARTYERASSHFLPLKKAVRNLADYLLGPYWTENKYNAGGWLMRNACGVAFRKTDWEDASDHTIRAKVLAWYLQGGEADKIHRLTARCTEEGIAVMGNEHDGLITAASIDERIIEDVLTDSELERKPFEEHGIEIGEEASDEELNGLQEEMNDVVRGRQ
jgi:hypothetical protein